MKVAGALFRHVGGAICCMRPTSMPLAIFHIVNSSVKCAVVNAVTPQRGTND
jgi:hypothetical protein